MTKFISPSAVVAVAVFVGVAGHTWSPLTTDVMAVSGVDCVAPIDWFPPSNIKKDPTADTNPGSNCDFHKWAWQEFLFLTDKVDGRPRFLSFPTDKDLLTLESTPPTFNNVPKRNVISLTPRINQSGDPRPLDSIIQAQTNGMALVDQNRLAVYYLIHVNQTYYDFVRENKFYDPKTYGSVSKDLNFKEGCVTIKSSWQIVPSGNKIKGFVTTDADVAVLISANGIVKISGKTRREKVALVGLHIVGRVQNHPEFVWATFEHDNNAPDLMDGDPDSANAVSNRPFTFYKANTAAKNCNQSNAGILQLTDPKAQTLDPIVNVFRQFSQGGGSDMNRNEIISLNKSVREQLKGKVPDSDWLNYSLVGSVWTNGKLLPDKLISFQDSKGSIRLQNTTMETTFQRQANCFTCHDTRHVLQQGVQLEGKNLNISHILRDNFFAGTESLRLKQFRAAKQ